MSIQIQRTEERYRFSELSTDAQERAISDRAAINSADPAWCDEWRDSLDAGAKALGFEVTGLDVSPFVQCSGVTINANPWAHCEDEGDRWDEGNEPPTGVRLWRVLRRAIDAWDAARLREARRKGRDSAPRMMGEECALTGYCGDEAFLDPLRAFMERPRAGVGFDDLMRECCDSWAAGYCADIEWQGSDECAREELESEELDGIAWANGAGTGDYGNADNAARACPEDAGFVFREDGRRV